jgi:hypothetical protein
LSENMGGGKPRKLSLTPIQREVLWTLEEAGEENLPTIMNTLRVKLPGVAGDDLSGIIRGAVEDLARRGFISVSAAADASGAESVILTEAGRQTLRR